MPERRPTPIRKVKRRKDVRLPAAPTVLPQFGPLSDGELGDQITGGYSIGATGKIRLPEYDPFQFAHEMFHLLDAQVLTDDDRARFAKILRSKGAWNQGTGLDSGAHGSGMEIAADYYAALATGIDPSKVTGPGVASYVSDFGPKRLRRFGNSLERLLKRRGLSTLDLDSYR